MHIYSGNESIDELLIAAKTDQDAFNELIKRTHLQLSRITKNARYRFPGGTSGDVTIDDLQSALVKVVKRLQKGDGYVDEKDYFSSFKYNVIHILIDKLRKKYKPVEKSTSTGIPKTNKKRLNQEQLVTKHENEEPRNEPGPRTVREEKEQAELLYVCALETLTTDEVSLFWEIKIENRTQKDVFERLGLKYSTGQDLLKNIEDKIKDEAKRRNLG